MSGVLIVFATTHGQTEKIAGYMAGRLRAHGVEAMTANVNSSDDLPPLDRFRAVVVGGALYMSRFRRPLRAFIDAHRDTLRAHPCTAFYSASGAASREHSKHEVETIAAEFLKDAGWQPGRVAHFGGAVKYPRYDPVTRWIMRRISKKEGGGTDTRREYEYTDWDAVDAFVDALLPPGGHGRP